MSKEEYLGQLGTITTAEMIMLDRRRRRETQSQAGERCATSRSIHSRWERGVLPGPVVKLREPLSDGERCLLYRRRCKKTQREVARELKRSRWWVNQMERDLVPCDELVWYWEQ